MQIDSHFPMHVSGHVFVSSLAAYFPLSTATSFARAKGSLHGVSFLNCLFVGLKPLELKNKEGFRSAT